MPVDRKVFRLLLSEIWRGKSVYRTLMNAALAQCVEVHGTVLDLGSGPGASYWRFVDHHNRTRLWNVDAGIDHRPHIVASLEGPLPVRPGSFDVVLAANVLEHVFACQQLMREVSDALCDGGRLFVCVPFMKEVHPDPHDFWRYTNESLGKLADEAGFEEVTVLSFGGLFLVIAEMLMPCLRYRLLKVLAVLVLVGLDQIVSRAITEKRNRETYVLGYLLSAKKPRTVPGDRAAQSNSSHASPRVPW